MTKKNATTTDEIWYDHTPIGKNTIGKFMKTLSEEAKLSAIFTNHSIRSTYITNLDAAGFESRHIMTVSSHKSESTIKTYAKKCPETKKCQMSETLSSKISKKKTCTETKVTAKNPPTSTNFSRRTTGYAGTARD